MLRYRVFVSSPGDVGEERLLAQKVISRLRVEYASRISVDAIFWEHEPLRATASFQEQISRPSEADAVVTILWSRIGTRLPSSLTRPDGSIYRSGTEFEFEDAADAHRRTGLPDLLVYRKMAPPVALLDDAVVQRLAEKRALDAFLEQWFRGADGSFTAAFHPFEAPPQFEELLECHLRKLIDARLLDRGPSHTASAPAVWQQGSPFRGLLSFDFEHASVFSGRTQAVSDVLHALRQQAALGHPFVLIVGGSGLGKSSLARAGILPTLTRPGVIEGVGLWRRAVLRPSAGAPDICLELVRALTLPDALPGLASSPADAMELAELVRSGSIAPLIRAQLHLAADEVQRVEKLDRRPDARLVLLIDQLEEIFTTPHIKPGDRDAFMSAVGKLVQSGLVWVIATIRSDFYPRCSEISALLSMKEGAGQYDLRPPNASEIGQIIRFPARLAGLDFEERPDTGERLDEVLRDAAVAEPEALPLLEFALEELYQRREEQLLTFAAYQTLGGLQGAVANRAEEVFGSLPDVAQSELGSCFSSLVTLDLNDQNLVVSRPASLDALRRDPRRAMLVDRFIEARLLVADRCAGGPATVRVAHDALLRLWPRLSEWMASNMATLRSRAVIAASAVISMSHGGHSSFLLPPGAALTLGSRLLRESPEELTGDEADYLARSLAAARRLARRRMAGRALLVAGAMLLVAAMAGYWEAYHHERVEYFSSSTLRWGLPAGIRALPPDAWQTRAESVRIRRTGRLGSIEVQILDDHEACIPTSQLLFDVYDIDAEALEEMFTRDGLFGDEKPEPCRWTYARRWNGAVDRVDAFATDGASIYAIQYEPYRLDRASFVNDKGYVNARFTTGAGVLEISYLSQGSQAGLVAQVRYFDAYGQPQPDANGICGSSMKYYDSGLIDRFMSLNCKWEPMLVKSGMAGAQVGYDAEGGLASIQLLGMDGGVVTTKDLGAQWRLSHDARGRLTALAILDEHDAPYIVPGWGIARATMRYDDRGRTVEVAYFDANDNFATLTPLGCARVLMAYESFDNMSRTECRSPDGALQSTELWGSAAKIELVNDARGVPLEVKYFDDLDRPRLWRFQDGSGNLRLDEKSLFAQQTVSYDERRGPDGRLYPIMTVQQDDAMEQEIFSFIVVHDANGREIRRWYTKQDQPIVKDGYHLSESSYNAAGLLAEIRYFGIDDQPVEAAQGFSRTTFTYDERGLTTQRSFFDLAGHQLISRVAIVAVDADGAAARAGLMTGDVILRFAGTTIETAEQMSALTGVANAGVRALIVERGAQEMSFDMPAGRLGISLDYRMGGVVN